jgi:hypothetical protein
MGFHLRVDRSTAGLNLQIEAATAEGVLRTDIRVRTASCFGLFAPGGWVPLDIEGPGREREIVYLNPQEISRLLSSTLSGEEIQHLTTNQIKIALHIGALVSRNAILSPDHKLQLQIELLTSELRETPLFDNPQFVQNFLTIFPEYILEAPLHVRENLDAWHTAISQNPNLIERAPPAIKEDLRILTVAVRQNGLLIQFAGPSIANDPELIRLAVRQNVQSLGYLPSQTLHLPLVVDAVMEVLASTQVDLESRSNTAPIDRFFSENKRAFRQLSKERFRESPIFNRAVKKAINDGIGSKSIIRKLLQNCPAARDDEEMVRIICRHHPEVLGSIGEDLLQDINFLTDFAFRAPLHVSLIPKERLVAVFERMNALILDEAYLRTLEPTIIGNKLKFYLQVIQKEPFFYHCLKDPVRESEVFIERALHANPACFKYLAEERKESIAYILEIARRVPGILSHVEDIGLRQQAVRELLAENPNRLKQMPITIQLDLTPILPFVLEDPSLVSSFESSCFADFLFVEELITSGPALLERDDFSFALMDRRESYGTICSVFKKHFPLLLSVRKELQNVLLNHDPDLFGLLVRHFVQEGVSDEQSILGGKRYVVSTMPEDISIRLSAMLGERPTGCSALRLLNEKVRAFVQTLPRRVEASAPRGGMGELILYQEDAIIVLDEALERIRTRRPFLGTPREDERESLELFYRQIENFLGKIDEKISADPRKNVDDKKQIIRALSVCGGGWLAHFEEMETTLCEVEVDAPFSLLVGKLVSVTCKNIVYVLNMKDASNPEDVHTYNGMLQVVNAYTGGRAPIDHLSFMPADPIRFAMEFAEAFSPLKVCESIAEHISTKHRLGDEFASYRDLVLCRNTPTNPYFERRIEEKEIELRSYLRGYADQKEFIRRLEESLERTGEKSKEIYRLLKGDKEGERLLEAFRNLRNSLSTPLLTDEECRFFVTYKQKFKEISILRGKISALTHLKEAEIFTDRMPMQMVMDAFIANKQQLIDEEAGEYFERIHMENGRIKPSGIALILAKLGFLTEV